MNVQAIKAIAYKEKISVKKSIKSLLIINVVFICILLATSIKKSSGFLDEGVTDVSNLLVGSTGYVSIFLSFVTFISTLKFWQEKSMDAIDSLFSLPVSIRKILVGKVAFSMLIGVIGFAVAFITSIIVYAVKFKVFAFSPVAALLMLAISLLLNFSYGIINGFCMWQLSIGKAKIIQGLTYVIFLGGIIGLNGCITADGINMNVVYALIAAVILLAAGAVYSLILANKEKIILNHIE